MLEKPPYAHGETEAVWEEDSGQLEPYLPSSLRVRKGQGIPELGATHAPG